MSEPVLGPAPRGGQRVNGVRGGRNRTGARSIEGHRHQVRPLTATELTRLVAAAAAVTTAHRDFDNLIEALYVAGVSQAAIGHELGITQGAVHIRVLRLRARRAAGGDAPRPAAPPARERPSRT